MSEKPDPTRPPKSKKIPDKLRTSIMYILRFIMVCVGIFLGLLFIILTNSNANPKIRSMEIAKVMSACKPHNGIAVMANTYNSVCIDGFTADTRTSIPEEIIKYYNLLEDNRVFVYYKIDYENYTNSE